MARTTFVVAHELDFLELQFENGKGTDLFERSVAGGTSALLAPVSAARIASEGVRKCREELTPDHGLMALDSLLTGVGATLLNPADHSLLESFWSVPQLREFLMRRFVLETEAAMVHLRRDYEIRCERLTAVKGRPQPESVMRALTASIPVIRCAFDEFSYENEVIRSICTALEVVDGELWRSAVHQETRSRAARCRNMLGEMQSMDRQRALATVNRVGGTASPYLPWRDLLRLASFVLHPSGDLRPKADLSVEIATDTANIWERILSLGLEEACGATVIKSSSVQDAEIVKDRPWEQLGDVPLRPDLIVRANGGLVLLDAKYKRSSGPPSRDDQFQLFAYSHLIRERAGRAIEQLRLVYPGPPGSNATTGPLRGRLGTPGAWLSVLTVPFPSANDVRPSAWSGYLNLISEFFQESLVSA